MTDDVYYMCKSDFDFELGNAQGGVRVHPSIKDLQAHQTCTQDRNGCGIVAVRVELVEVKKDSDY